MRNHCCLCYAVDKQSRTLHGKNAGILLIHAQQAKPSIRGGANAVEQWGHEYSINCGRCYHYRLLIWEFPISINVTTYQLNSNANGKSRKNNKPLSHVCMLTISPWANFRWAALQTSTTDIRAKFTSLALSELQVRGVKLFTASGVHISHIFCPKRDVS